MKIPTFSNKKAIIVVVVLFLSSSLILLASNTTGAFFNSFNDLVGQVKGAKVSISALPTSVPVDSDDSSDSSLVTKRADLIVQSIDFYKVDKVTSFYSGETITEGDSIYYKITFKNQGNFAAYPFYYYISSSSGAEGQLYVGRTLMPGEIYSTFGSNLQIWNTGRYSITITADSKNQVIESNESNNSYYKSIYVYTEPEPVTCTDSDGGKDYYTPGRTKGQASYTDSVVDIMDYCGGTPDNLNTYVVEFYCQNNMVYSEKHDCSNGCQNGACLSEPEINPSITIISNPQANISGNVKIRQGEQIIIYGTVANPPGQLGVDYSRAFFFGSIFNNSCTNNDWTMTCTANQIGTSNFYIEMYVNGKTYKSNTIAVTVIPSIYSKPDLTITDIIALPAQPEVNEEVTITVKGKNIGNANLDSSQGILNFGAFFTDFVKLRMALPDPTATNPLKPGDEFYFGFTGYFKSGGNKSLTFIVDNANELPELNENNNSLTRTITVGDAIVSLKNGDLIKFNTQFYLFENNQRRPIPYIPGHESYRDAVLDSWGLKKENAIELSQSQMESYAIGKNLTIKPNTYILKLASSDALYNVEYDNAIKQVDSVANHPVGYSDFIIVPDAFFVDYVTITTTSEGELILSNASNNPAMGAIIADTTQTIGEFNFKALNEDIKIEKISFNISGSSSAYYNIDWLQLYNGSTKLGEIQVTGNNVTITPSSLVIAKGSTKNLTLKAVTHKVGLLDPGTSGDNFVVAVSGINAKGVYSSSTNITVNGLNTTKTNPQYIYKTLPVISKISLSGLANGKQDLYKFNVMANSAGDVGIYKFTFSIEKYSVDVYNLELYEINGGIETLLTSNPVSLSNGLVEMYVRNKEYTTIPAGATKTFVLRGDVTGWDVNANLITKHLGDNGNVLTPNTAFSIDNNSNNNFIWSDLFLINSSSTATSANEWTNGRLIAGLISPQSSITTPAQPFVTTPTVPIPEPPVTTPTVPTPKPSITKIIPTKSTSPEQQQESEPTPINKPKPALKPTPVAQRVKGKLLLQVEQGGAIWYVDDTNYQKHNVTWDNALPLFENFALGISDEDLLKIPADVDSINPDLDSDNDGYTDVSELTYGFSPYVPGAYQGRFTTNMSLANRLKGKFLLQVNQGGAIWYVDQNGFRHNVRWSNLMDLFRKLSLGITDSDLGQITTGN